MRRRGFNATSIQYPGEGETRPLDPTEVVYTTAQKVADLLDIGPQEAVLMSKDADTGMPSTSLVRTTET